MAGDDGRCTCLSQVWMDATTSIIINRYFVKRHLHCTPPLILIVYSRLDRGIQSATEMLPLTRGRRCCTHFHCNPRLSICVLLTHLFCFFAVRITASKEKVVLALTGLDPFKNFKPPSIFLERMKLHSLNLANWSTTASPTAGVKKFPQKGVWSGSHDPLKNFKPPSILLERMSYTL